MLEKLVSAILYILPAYVANGSPVVVVRLIGKATPMDLGAKAWDGRRILGDGKTFEGFFSGIALGSIVGLILIALGNPASYRSILEPLILSLGAMLGDILGSFIKRRLGLKRGQPAPGMDQLGFVVCALIISFAIYGLPDWFDSLTVIILLLVTACLHLGTNYLAYLLGLKSEPY